MSLVKVNNDLYDMHDISHDGAVILEKFRTVMKIAYSYGAEEEDATFHLNYTNQPGWPTDLRFWMLTFAYEDPIQKKHILTMDL